MGGSAQSLSADAHAETRRKNHFRDMAGPMSASDLSAFVFDDRRVWLPHWRRAFHLDVVGCKKTKIGREPQNQCDVSGYRGLGCPSGNAAQAQAAAALFTTRRPIPILTAIGTSTMRAISAGYATALHLSVMKTRQFWIWRSTTCSRPLPGKKYVWKLKSRGHRFSSRGTMMKRTCRCSARLAHLPKVNRA